MPAGKKIGGAKLHASAKEFVPTPPTSQATVTAWKPTISSNSSARSKAPSLSKVNGSDKQSQSPAPKNAVKPAPKAAPASAWGSKKAKPVKKVAPPQPQNKGNAQRQQNNQGRGGRGGKQQGGDRNNSGSQWGRNSTRNKNDVRDNNGRDGGNRRQNQDSGHRKQYSNRDGNEDAGPDGNTWSRGKVLAMELMQPGEGSTDAEKAVKRISVDDLLAMRVKFVDAPPSWGLEDNTNKPPEIILWTSPTRLEEIQASSQSNRIGGDVSAPEKKKNKNETAPLIEDCKPLEVNEGTRWKSKVFDGKESQQGEEVDSMEEILRKAMVILNKLSLTKFDKLSDGFINCGIGRDVECLTGAVGLIVTYAQEQPHFASMYAGLCLKLVKTPMEGIDGASKKGKKFKKVLLERCQTEFETDIATKIVEATKGITDKALIDYHATLIKKQYLGHMRFIGELYKGDLLSIKIILSCLPALLTGDSEHPDEVDEEKVECFVKLMTVIGSSLEQQGQAMANVGKTDIAEKLAKCWKTVEIMAGKRKGVGLKVSNRIKFMLQDLLEMKSKGWVTRRKEETAKTLAQIHNEVAKEERAAARRGSTQGGKGKSNIRRGASSGDVRVLNKAQQKPQVDADGFVSIPQSSKSFSRSASMSAMPQKQTDGYQKYNTRGSTVNISGMAKSSSQSKFAVLNESKSPRKSKSKGSSAAAKIAPAEEQKPKVNYPTPRECGEKSKNYLKEYFIGGDIDDAVLSIHELVGVGDEGSVERGTKVVEQAVLMVLEMKQTDVDKMMTVYLRCAKEKTIESESFVLGLNDPVEFLGDVAIDAPLATPILIHIVSELIKAEILPFGFLLETPDYFRTDGQAATFAAKVLTKIGENAAKSDENVEVVTKLMTDDDRVNFNSASDLIANVIASNR